MEEDEKYNEFTHADRNEFIFRIFKILCRGGPLNQVCPKPILWFMEAERSGA